MTQPGRWITAFILGIGLVSSHAALAVTLQETGQFDEASKDYQGGDFAKAREIFENLAAEHKSNANLYYNLGNTYYRLGQTGRAILWYERALRERPFDSDMRDNLALARTGIKGDEETPFEKIVGLPPISWLFMTAALFLWMGAGLLILILLKDEPAARWLKRLMVLSLSLWVILASWGTFRWWDESKAWGIVVTQDIPVRSGPGNEFAVGATAPEGLKVLLLEERDGWVLVGLPKAGIKGWTPEAGVERIE